MNVLVLGGGGREHALQWAIQKSPQCDKVFINPGNGGTINNVATRELRQFIEAEKIGLVVVGPDHLLEKGVVDQIQDLVPVIGPTKSSAKLETDKFWAKQFMDRHQIPTAPYQSFTDYDSAKSYVTSCSMPMVIKASGLAAGKGAFICYLPQQAVEVLDDIMIKKVFGHSGDTVIIENVLVGMELSYFILVRDNYEYVVLPEAMDYKRLGDWNAGPNTGGMGAISPVPFCNARVRLEIEETIVKPTLAGLKKEGIPYKGFIYFGLMVSKDITRVVEYNCRLGDPEAQVILPRIKSDFLGLLLGDNHIEVSEENMCGVVLAAKGYPSNPQCDEIITGLEDNLVFHAGTVKDGNDVLSAAGRVLTVVGVGYDAHSAQANAYRKVKRIDFPSKYYRKDIGDSQ